LLSGPLPLGNSTSTSPSLLCTIATVPTVPDGTSPLLPFEELTIRRAFSPLHRHRDGALVLAHDRGELLNGEAAGEAPQRGFPAPPVTPLSLRARRLGWDRLHPHRHAHTPTAATPRAATACTSTLLKCLLKCLLLSQRLERRCGRPSDRGRAALPPARFQRFLLLLLLSCLCTLRSR